MSQTSPCRNHLTRSAPLSASLSAGVCRELLLLHWYLSLLVMCWNIPPFHHCWSVCGVLMTSDDMEMNVEGLWSPKVAFSDVIFSFYFHRCWLQDEKAVSFSVIHNPKRHFLNFMSASRAFLFMRLNWLASEKPHSWYLFSLEICGQRDPCQHYSLPAENHMAADGSGPLKQPGRCFSMQRSDISSPKYCYCLTEWALKFSVWFAAIVCSFSVNAATGNERMLMLWGGMDMNN